MQSLNNTVIIIPTYNEVKNIPTLVADLGKLNLSITILFVDGNSTDGTGELIEKLRLKYNFIEILNQAKKNGYGGASKAGFNWAIKIGASIIGTMDADLSHRPEDLPKLLGAINNADFVIGSRRVQGGEIIGWSWWRHIESAGATFIARLLLGIKSKDVTSGFRLYRVSELNKLPWKEVATTGYAWLEEILYLAEKQNLKIKEVPITFYERKEGKSKLTLKDIIGFFVTILKLKFKKH